MTTVSTYEVTSTPPIGPSLLPTDASALRWRLLSQQRNCKPKSARGGLRSPKRFGLETEMQLGSLWQRGAGSKQESATSKNPPRRIRGSRIDSRHGNGEAAGSWQSSAFGGVDMLVNSSLMASVQANMVLMAVAVALGITTLLLLGLSILCHPLWIVKLTQKLQPDILYLKHTQEKIVALTLDDGPHAHITPQLLDILKENNCKATWFVIGEHMELCPDVVKRIHAEGHEVANHMMRDVASWRLSKSKFEKELLDCEDLLRNFFRYNSTHNSTPKPLKWFRPGHGFYNPQILQTCKEHGYRVALGSLYPMDHMFVKQAKLLVRNLLWRIHPGAIIILHDRLPQSAQTPEVLRLLLPELKKRGYKIVTLSELDESLSNTVKPHEPHSD